MDDKQSMQADGGDTLKGAPDGVAEDDVGGKAAGGESDGGSYPNPHSGKEGGDTGVMGHGGQTEIAYSGGDNPNAPTKED